MPEDVALRPVRESDEAFLYRVYASTRSDELAPVPWTAAEKEAFLRQQFAAQHRYYREQFRTASFDLIERGGEPLGRLYVDRRRDEIRVIDIALLPEHRGGGLGNALMQRLLDEAAAQGQRVSVHVERENPALRLYRRLGFVHLRDEGPYLFMEWSPPEVGALS